MCLGGLIGASVVPWRSDMRLVGALKAPWGCSGGALEVPQKCLGRAQHLSERLRGASEPPHRRLTGVLGRSDWCLSRASEARPRTVEAPSRCLGKALEVPWRSDRCHHRCP